jgi:hypothetical protein
MKAAPNAYSKFEEKVSGDTKVLIRFIEKTAAAAD